MLPVDATYRRLGAGRIEGDRQVEDRGAATTEDADGDVTGVVGPLEHEVLADAGHPRSVKTRWSAPVAVLTSSTTEVGWGQARVAHRLPEGAPAGATSRPEQCGAARRRAGSVLNVFQVAVRA